MLLQYADDLTKYAGGSGESDDDTGLSDTALACIIVFLVVLPLLCACE